jgi:hypothetical protein
MTMMPRTMPKMTRVRYDPVPAVADAAFVGV